MLAFGSETIKVQASFHTWARKAEPGGGGERNVLLGIFSCVPHTGAGVCELPVATEFPKEDYTKKQVLSWRNWVFLQNSGSPREIESDLASLQRDHRWSSFIKTPPRKAE